MKKYIVSIWFVVIVACAPAVKSPVTAIETGPSVSELAEEFCNAQIEGVSEAMPYFVKNPKGLILFIPQLHRRVGTTILDPINDNSVLSQQEIFIVLKALVEVFDVPYIGTEGATPEAVDHNNSLVSYLRQLRLVYEELSQTKEDSCQSQEEAKSDGEIREICSLMQEGVEFAGKYYNRYMILENAVLRIKSGSLGDNVLVTGVEHPFGNNEIFKLMDKHSQVFAQITHLRLKEFDHEYGTEFAESLTEDKVRLYLRIYSWMLGESLKPPALRARINLALLSYLKQNNSQSTNISFLRDVLLFNRAYNFFMRLVEYETGGMPSDSLTENFYADFTDLDELVRIQKELEKKIDILTLEKREAIAVAIVEEVFEKYQFRFGVVIYGADHTDNFATSFNQAGFSVIVLRTPILENFTEQKEAKQ